MKLQLPPGPFNAYLFDCDGTIADSMPLHYIAWTKALAEWNCTFDEQLDYERAAVEKNRAFAGQAAQGTFFGVRVEHGAVEHSRLVTSADGADVVVNFVRRISREIAPARA